MRAKFPLFYFIFCIFLYILALPLLLASLFRTKHKKSIPARFFGANFKLDCKPKYWFHACSFGEVKSLEPLILELAKNAPDSEILITIITQTGFDEAKRLFCESNFGKLDSQIFVKFLPFEIFLPFWSQNLRNLRTLCVMEAELWRMLFYTAKAAGAKTMLLNARISDKSESKYMKMAWFYARIFALVDCVLAQSTKDKARLENLGARGVEIFGNLKMLNVPKVTRNFEKPKRAVVLAASTHRGEEELILNAFLEAQKEIGELANGASFENLDSEKSNEISESKKFQNLKNALLLIVPRHPERFAEVEKMLMDKKADFQKFSALDSENPESKSVISDSDKQILLVDKLGILVDLYAIADVVLLGGAWVKVGGHNPLEPAFFGTRLISGEHIFNQQALFSCVQNAVLVKPKDLPNALKNVANLQPSSAEFKIDMKEKIVAMIL